MTTNKINSKIEGQKTLEIINDLSNKNRGKNEPNVVSDLRIYNILHDTAFQFNVALREKRDITIPEASPLALLPYTLVLEFLFRLLGREFTLEHILVPQIAKNIGVTPFEFGWDNDGDDVYIEIANRDNDGGCILFDVDGTWQADIGSSKSKYVSKYNSFAQFICIVARTFKAEAKKLSGQDVVVDSIAAIRWALVSRKITNAEKEILRKFINGTLI